MLGKFSTKKGMAPEEIDSANIPEHIAIIMDGNGRWAKKKGLPRIAGHREGMKVVRNIVMACNEIGVKALTLYAFSTENWKRPKKEVDFLMKAPEKFLLTYLPELVEKNVQVRTMGNPDNLPGSTVNAVETAVAETQTNTGLILNFAWNYGSRFEITQALRHIAQEVKDGKVDIDQIDEGMISDYLLSPQLGDPDLLIRTSGELRLSNFMLWQLAYTELWFTDVLWPDFKKTQLFEAVRDYQQRGRRFGGV
ncbi:MAG TPA: isoprenyl transferase [Bacillales bacterium]